MATNDLLGEIEFTLIVVIDVWIDEVIIGVDQLFFDDIL